MVYTSHVQADGKILVAYTTGNSGSPTYAIARFTSTFGFDTTFGTNGVFENFALSDIRLPESSRNCSGDSLTTCMFAT